MLLIKEEKKISQKQIEEQIEEQIENCFIRMTGVVKAEAIICANERHSSMYKTNLKKTIVFLVSLIDANKVKYNVKESIAEIMTEAESRTTSKKVKKAIYSRWKKTITTAMKTAKNSKELTSYLMTEARNKGIDLTTIVLFCPVCGLRLGSIMEWSKMLSAAVKILSRKSALACQAI